MLTYQVEKITTNVQPNVGDTFIYTVTLKNNGVDTATNVEVTELFPNNISVHFSDVQPTRHTHYALESQSDSRPVVSGLCQPLHPLISEVLADSC